MTDVNVPLLRKAVEWVEQQATLPEIDREWRQAIYTCDPQHLAMAVAMETLAEAEPSASWDDVVNVAAQLEPHCGTAYCVAGYIGQMLDERFKDTDFLDDEDLHVSEFASEALGLTGAQGIHLFRGSNNAADIRRLAEKYAGEAL